MVKITVDGKEIRVPVGSTLLQACEMAGVEIPRFCYHERLSIAGNCRMCLVEVEKEPKLVASCARTVTEGMTVHTTTQKVRHGRKGVMEFLLINHPLDCPICDQGGECDLQDEAIAYGFDKKRYSESKRAVEDKNMGPLIKTVMTRCIHCTRCVRFAQEVAGVPELGATGRGETMEIVTYLDATLTSEMSGNMIDLCPVGALTSKPYAFTARSWELRQVETVDVMDALGSNIRVDARGRDIMRILPLVNEDINEEWISDRTRFVWDALRLQRLDRPYVRRKGQLQEASWQEAFTLIAQRFRKTKGDRIAALAGDLACAESLKALKDLMDLLGSPHMDCRQDRAKIGFAGRGGYLFNSTIAGVEQADVLLLVGCDPRLEAPVLNARIFKCWHQGNLQVGYVGTPTNLNYEVELLGDTPDLLTRENGFFKRLKQAKTPMMILGMGALTRLDGEAVFAAAVELAHKTGMFSREWNGFNVLHTAAARVAALDLSFLPRKGGYDTQGICTAARRGEIDLVYLLGADDVPMDAFEKSFVIYQGSHGDAGAHAADVILPGAAYTEKDATWVNTEGRPQQGRRVIFPPGEAKEDWRILRALSEALGTPLPYDTLQQLRAAIATQAPALGRIGEIVPAEPPSRPAGPPLQEKPLTPAQSDPYLTNPITRASQTLAECSRLYQKSP